MPSPLFSETADLICYLDMVLFPRKYQIVPCEICKIQVASENARIPKRIPLRVYQKGRKNASLLSQGRLDYELQAVDL